MPRTATPAPSLLGYVIRTGHRLTLTPARRCGRHDADTLQLAVANFGHLIPHGPHVTETLASFAARVELTYANPQARAVADTLHRFSA